MTRRNPTPIHSRSSGPIQSLLALLILLAPGVSIAAALQVRLEGVSGGEEENIRAMVDLFDLTQRDDLEAGTVAFYLDRVAEQVTTALIPFGYYRPTVHTALNRDRRPWVAEIRVEKGAPVRVASMAVHFLAAGDPARFDFTLPRFPLGVGDRLDHQQYERGKRALRNALYDHGFLDVVPSTQEVRVDPNRGEAYVTLVWDVGVRHHFGPVSFSGSQLNDRMMNRFLTFETGDPFSQDLLLKFSNRLRDSGYFSRVDVEPQLDLPDHSVPVSVAVVPSARTLYQFGISYGTDTGAGFDTDVRRRWVNASGHRAAARFVLGQRRSEASVHYDIPSSSQFDSYYQVGLSLTDEETDAADSRALRVGISRLRPWRGWHRTDAINFLQEESIFGETEVQSNFLIPAVSLSKTRGDGDPVPRRGYSLRGTLRGAAEGLISDTSLLQLDVSARRIISPTERTRMLFRGRLGLTLTDDFDELPASLRFFAGGDRSIRGYDYEALGPRDGNGGVIGGRHLLEASTEFEFKVRGPWRGAVFIDGGNALSDLDDDLEAGAGFGVRYESPIGLIRADVGFPVTEDAADVRFHFSVGPDL